MRTLQEQLDDPEPADCGRCAVCTAPRWALLEPDPALVREATLALRSRPLVLDAKKMAPDAEGAMRKIPEGVRVEEGRALARIGDAGWWPAIAAGLEGGRVDDEVVSALADLVRSWGPDGVRWLTWVPSRSAGAALEDVARRLGAELGLPAVDAFERVRDAPPQREMANAAQQVANVRGALRVHGDLPPGAALLLDDRRLSGWTLAMAGGQLRGRGASAVWPLALASAL
jgi:ATP-dependent DNA helicase RecQ